MGLILLLVLRLIFSLQETLDHRLNRTAIQVEGLARLPRGEYLKPAVLGYRHVAADVLWLRLVQVIGQKRNTADEYEWMYHALDVITTLDPRYTYAYEAGGTILTELAHRTDLSNRILEKGYEANPNVWRLPFQLGYNHFFYLADPGRAAGYIAQAARLPGGPAYLPGLATRMYAEAEDPEVALEFLAAMWAQTDNSYVKAELETRMKELIIERDVRHLERAVSRYRERNGAFPDRLQELVGRGDLGKVPEEPFGGAYVLDATTGKITSTTHPKRLRVIRPEEAIKPPQ
ncbi:hypothetical protein [Nitrospira sp. Nam74]